jgi:hypothetical protein
MTVPIGLSLLALVIAGGLYASRSLQRGYIDYLSPLLVMYAIHAFTRGAVVFYRPDWLHLNPQVAGASEMMIAEAMLLTAAALAALIVCYVTTIRIFSTPETPLRSVIPASLGWAGWLIVVGLSCRLLLRMAVEELIALPDWAATPIETFGWAALAGVYIAGFNCGRRRRGRSRRSAAWLVALGTLAILAVDARISVSREATLQPILAALLGLTMGAGVPIRRIATLGVAVSFPLFIWIGAMKAYVDLELGQGPGYLTAMSTVREHSEMGWVQWMTGTTQDRFHALDSLIVTRLLVPAQMPFESDSIWTRVFVSAFVPRAVFPDKQVGWGSRFATDFWGLAPEMEGRAAVGISHLGTFYVYGGAFGCITGMAVIGFGLGLLAADLRRRRSVFGPTLFVLTALTICQVDRDLEVVLGGALKQVAIFAGFMLLGALGDASTPLRAARAGIGRRPDLARLA